MRPDSASERTVSPSTTRGDFAGRPVHRIAADRFDRDRLGQRADRQREVGGDAAVGGELEPASLRFAEALELRRDGVAADRQAREHVAAGAVRRLGPGESGVRCS